LGVEVEDEAQFDEVERHEMREAHIPGVEGTQCLKNGYIAGFKVRQRYIYRVVVPVDRGSLTDELIAFLLTVEPDEKTRHRISDAHIVTAAEMHHAHVVLKSLLGTNRGVCLHDKLIGKRHAGEHVVFCFDNLPRLASLEGISNRPSSGLDQINNLRLGENCPCVLRGAWPPRA